MIIIITRKLFLEKHKKELREHRLLVIFGFRIYIFKDYNIDAVFDSEE